MTQHHPYRSNTQKSGNPFPKARLLLHVAVMVVLLMAATGKSLQAADILVGGVLNTNTTWTGQNTYIVIETIEVPTGITLNIEAGANILFNRTTGLRVEGGRLIATGNANDSIFMLPNHHPGDNWYWQGLTVNGITNQNFVRLSHARIAHATTGITGNAADFVVLERNSIDNNLLAGIVINNGSSWQITYNQVINNINGLEILANNPDSQATDNHGDQHQAGKRELLAHQRQHHRIQPPGVCRKRHCHAQYIAGHCYEQPGAIQHYIPAWFKQQWFWTTMFHEQFNNY